MLYPRSPGAMRIGAKALTLVTAFLLLNCFISTPLAFQPCGVLYNYDENILLSNGFVKCYDQPYSWPTTSSDLAGCMSFQFVFVGAKSSSSSSTFVLGAFGTSNVFAVTSSTTTAYYDPGGAYWYRYPSYSFGFASSSTVSLNQCDTDGASNDCTSRLCWHLDLGSFGGYRAGCTTGLNGDPTWRKVMYGGNTACVTDINQCLPNGGLGPCAQICTYTPGSFICSCNAGYTLSGYACNDVNECASNGGRGPCDQICVNTVGSFYCSCQSGYLLSGHTCNDINECLPNGGLGPCAQICTNTPGSFFCSCNPGYSLNGYACNDINECLPNGGKGPCPQVCVNTPGSFYCTCYTCVNGLCINASCWCVSTYTGSNCSQPEFSGFDTNPCLNGGYCESTEGAEQCTCVCPPSTNGLYCEYTEGSCTLSTAAASALSTMINRRRNLGTSVNVPAQSCAEIKSVRSDVTTGVYWTLNANGLTQLTFCQY